MNLKKATDKEFNSVFNFKMGAVVENDASISFRIWLPKAKAVYLQCRPFNACTPIEDYKDIYSKEKVIKEFLEKIYNHKARFPKVISKIAQNNWHFIFGKHENKIKLAELENNIFYINSKDIANLEVKTNYLYRFLVQYDNEDNLTPLKDPYTNFQPFDTDGWSQIIDHRLYNWNDNDFISSIRQYTNTNLIDNKTILEMHIGAYTQEGTFEAAKNKIQQIADDGIFDIIEILPVADFYGKMNWGYDGVDLFAPDSTYCNHPDAFKDFVNLAHNLNLKVVLDVVYNHYGPDYSASEFINDYNSRTPSPWGNSPNLSSLMVKKYILDNLFYWIENFHIDGFRLDATYAIDRKNQLKNDLFLKELTLNVKKRYPGIILIAEDIRNAPRITRQLDYSELESLCLEDYDYYYFYKKSKINEKAPYNIGFDAQWNVDFTKSIESFLTGNEKNYSLGVSGSFHNDITEIIRLLKHGSIRPFDMINIDDSSWDHNIKTNINYISCHDSIGNYNGTRLILKILQSRLLKSGNIIIYRENILKHLCNTTHKQKSKEYIDNLLKRREDQLLSKLMLLIINAYYISSSNKEVIDTDKWSNICYEIMKQLHLMLYNCREYNTSNALVAINGLDLLRFVSILDDSISLNKLAFVLLYLSDGIKMIFMGDEEGLISPFKYFRDFPTQFLEEKIILPEDKGYDIDYSAFIGSKITDTNLKLPGIKDFIKQLSKFYRNNEIFSQSIVDKVMLLSDLINTHSSKFYNNVLLVRKKHQDNYLYAILNFSDGALDFSFEVKDHSFFKYISEQSELKIIDCSNPILFSFNNGNGTINIQCPKYSFGLIF